MNILSVDFGTSSVKMAVLDQDLKIISDTKVEYQYQVIDEYKVQIDAEIIFSAFLKGIKQLGDYAGKIDVVVPCNLSPSLVAMDKEGNPLYPIILQLDKRSYKQSKYIVKTITKENFINITGNLPFAGGISCTSILWIKDNFPEVYKNTYKFGHFNTFFHYQLVGKWVIDPSNASFTGLYETVKGSGWSSLLCNSLDIDIDKLPDIVPSMSVTGYLSKKAAEVTGLREGIPIIMGANDTTSAVYGAGAINRGDILNISGSSEIIALITDKPIANEKYCLRVSMETGKWIYQKMTVGGFALEWFRKEFYREMNKGVFYNEYLQGLLQNSTGTSGVRFIPYLAGDRHSLIKKKGAFSGLVLDTSREDMLLSLLEGIYEPLSDMLNICKGQMELNTKILWTGGMVSDAYFQFKKKIFKGFELTIKKECSTLGNAKVAINVLSK